MTQAHWTIFVDWKTVIGWKQEMRDARATGSGIYPYQYGSSQERFTDIKKGDVLWVFATPRYGKRGNATATGRARPPAVLARLRVKAVCCHQPGCAKCRELPPCDYRAHPSSSLWPILVIGEKDPEEETPDPYWETYPPLYNAFSVMRKLAFDTKGGETNLQALLERIEQGDEATWGTAGPYGGFGQSLQRLRKLSLSAAGEMDKLHRRAVEGRRVFFSYRWMDVEDLARKSGLDRRSWIGRLHHALEELEMVPWLDHHQLAPQGPDTGLLEELLSDAVRQATLFVAFATPSYGAPGSWSAAEWIHAGKQRQKVGTRSLQQIPRLALLCGGDPALLDDGRPSRRIELVDTRPEAVASVIAKNASGS